MLLARWLVLILFQLLAVSVYAADKLSLTLVSGESQGRYSDSPYRDSLKLSDYNIDIEMPKRWGVSLGLEKTLIQYKYGIPQYQQNAIFFSYRSSSVPSHQLREVDNNYLHGHLPGNHLGQAGRYTTRLDFYCVAERNNKYSADNTCIFAPQLSYMRLDKSLYVDLGYALEQYAATPQDTESLHVEQWTPTLAMALNARATHWLQLRAYIMHYSNVTRTQQKDQSKALEVKYTYYPLSLHKIVPTYIETGILVGERMYSVDRDSNSVSNLADVEKEAISFNIRWRLARWLALMLNFSRKQFYEQTVYLKDDYSYRASWLGLAVSW